MGSEVAPRSLPGTKARRAAELGSEALLLVCRHSPDSQSCGFAGVWASCGHTIYDTASDERRHVGHAFAPAARAATQGSMAFTENLVAARSFDRIQCYF